MLTCLNTKGLNLYKDSKASGILRRRIIVFILLLLLLLTGKMIVWYILIFTFLDSQLEDITSTELLFSYSYYYYYYYYHHHYPCYHPYAGYLQLYTCNTPCC